MTILTRCCCFKSVKNGSFASAIYTLVLYIMILTAGTFHIHSVHNDLMLLIFTIIMVCLSTLLVITSILLLIGLCGDNTNLMLPWLIVLSVTTLLDLSVSLYLFCTSAIDPFKAILFIIDFVICIFNTYCFLCVISNYQQILLIKTQCRYRTDKQFPSNRDFHNGKYNGCYSKDLKPRDNGQSMTSTNIHNNHKDEKHYLSVNRDYRNELSVITEEHSGVFIEPHRKISSDASSGGRTDISQLMSSHEEWSGIKSPIIEDLNIMNELSENEIESREQNVMNERMINKNTVIIINELLE